MSHAHFRSIPSRSGNGYCSSGGRRWFVRHGLDWTAFVKHGIEAEALLATGDGMALALVDWARECEAREQGNG